MIPLLPAVAGSAAGWLTNNVFSLTDALNNFISPQIITPAPRNTGSALAGFLLNEYDFKFMVFAPSNDDLQGIDDFFTSYGYRVDRFQVPKLNVKTPFTFVKTRDAQVTSSVREAAEQMAAMLNAGCKFWQSEIGQGS